MLEENKAGDELARKTPAAEWIPGACLRHSTQNTRSEGQNACLKR